MSAPLPTVRPVNPWHRLRALVGWTLGWHDGGDELGWCDFETQTISLRRGLTQAERRSTVLHEVIHAERGAALTTLEDREELRVRRQVARELLPDVRLIGEALAWALSFAEAADELWVDEGVLRDRLRWLHPSERHYLRRRLDD